MWCFKFILVVYGLGLVCLVFDLLLVIGCEMWFFIVVRVVKVMFFCRFLSFVIEFLICFFIGIMEFFDIKYKYLLNCI